MLRKFVELCAIIACHAFHPIASLLILADNDYVCMRLCVRVTDMKVAAQLSGGTEDQPADEATVSPTVNPQEQEIRKKKILDSQYKCFEKMNRDVPYNKSGSGQISMNQSLDFLSLGPCSLDVLTLPVTLLF